MGGWKTWAAAGGLCLLGLAMIGMGLVAIELKEILFGLGLQAILFGFGLVGLGHKVEKNAPGLGKTPNNSEPEPARTPTDG